MIRSSVRLAEAHRTGTADENKVPPLHVKVAGGLAACLDALSVFSSLPSAVETFPSLAAASLGLQ